MIRTSAFVVGFWLAFGADATAQNSGGFGGSRWRDQRAPGAKPSVFLNVFAGNSNPAAIYQSVGRTQIEFRSQLRTQQQEIARFSDSSSVARSPFAGPFDPRMADARMARLGSAAERYTTGHPTYFFRREEYFPRFKQLGKN